MMSLGLRTLENSFQHIILLCGWKKNGWIDGWKEGRKKRRKKERKKEGKGSRGEGGRKKNLGHRLTYFQ